ncbi:hypothetical protein H310_15334 [Aphanomyces invadans]|uniref:Uncharacterized protein n=1 Tax=Aphanomyces invadans TaxID=157072 RepID=A0A024T8B8_9STRA|nr:hypothetical protein H310_15334 [Aphanomyces invadans]ETV89826.1 hypothetical protein H310_15334 [Aphanomyces invadans]|eukprot:XP_008881541.1 hypothetical protein H310_15334 [Aphanomyces invadans]
MLSKKLKAVNDAGVRLAARQDLETANDDLEQATSARYMWDSPTHTEQQDGYALGILITCCSESQKQYIANKDTYVEAWCALAEHHEPKTRVDRLATLTEIFNMKWNTKQESLPQLLERYEMLFMRAVTHQVHTMPRTKSNILATVRVVLEAEYKAALRFNESHELQQRRPGT